MPLYTVALEGNAFIIISKYACCELGKFWRELDRISILQQNPYSGFLTLRFSCI